MPSTSTALSIFAIARRTAAALTLLAGAAGAQLTPEWISTLPVGTDLSAGLGAYVIDDAGITYVTGAKGGPIGYLDIVTAAFAPDGTLYITVVGPKKADENAPKEGKLLKIAPGL